MSTKTLPTYKNKNGEDVSQESISEFLDALRELGSINMFGAAPYVKKQFKISDTDARKAWAHWAENFGK